jgi:K+-sensing histidine kinase KdpD
MWGDGLTGICGRAVRTGTSQLIPDVYKDPDYLPIDRRTRSELVVPIKVGDEVVGVINVEHPEKNIFSEDDRQVLEMLASNASIAIQNARTFEELNAARLNIESLTNLFWTGAFAQAWQHSIRNHSVIVSDCVKLIRDDLDKGYPMSGVYEKLFQIESIIDEIQSIPMPPLSSEDGIESILVHQLIQDRIKQYRQKNGRFAEITYNVELHTGVSTSIRAGREWIRRLLDILIHNAVNAMNGSEQKVLTLQTDMEKGMIKISVIDTGHGIPTQIFPKLFKAPITKAKGEKGSGIGLYLGMEIAKTYGGLLEIETTT